MRGNIMDYLRILAVNVLRKVQRSNRWQENHTRYQNVKPNEFPITNYKMYWEEIFR
jgi:hypothetical protein